MLSGALVVTPAVMASAVAQPTAYTVEPLNVAAGETTPTLLDGAVCAVYDCVTVPTSGALDLSHVRGVFGEDGSISEGALALDDKLIADDGEKLVFGYSQGAQVAGFWLRNYAPTTVVNRENTSFLLVGDPENTYGVPWAPRVPTDTGFAVTEVWAQYDGWADWPTRFDVLAIANAAYGMLFVHPTVYDDLDLATEKANGNVVTWKSGGITHEMVVEEDLPILDPLRNVGLGWIADAVNDDWRAHIEAQYDRPATQDEADELFGDEVDEVDATDETDATEMAEMEESDVAVDQADDRRITAARTGVSVREPAEDDPPQEKADAETVDTPQHTRDEPDTNTDTETGTEPGTAE